MESLTLTVWNHRIMSRNTRIELIVLREGRFGSLWASSWNVQISHTWNIIQQHYLLIFSDLECSTNSIIFNSLLNFSSNWFSEDVFIGLRSLSSWLVDMAWDANFSKSAFLTGAAVPVEYKPAGLIHPFFKLCLAVNSYLESFLSSNSPSLCFVYLHCSRICSLYEAHGK